MRDKFNNFMYGRYGNDDLNRVIMWAAVICAVLSMFIFPQALTFLTYVLLISGIFALVASLIYFWSGSAPGIYCIPLLTGLAVFAAIFRQAYLRKGFVTLVICSAVSLLLYELAVFGIGSFLGYTIPARFFAFPTSALLTLALVPVIYPILLSIGKIGGETWKE